MKNVVAAFILLFSGVSFAAPARYACIDEVGLKISMQFTGSSFGPVLGLVDPNSLSRPVSAYVIRGKIREDRSSRLFVFRGSKYIVQYNVDGRILHGSSTGSLIVTRGDSVHHIEDLFVCGKL